MIGRCMYIWKLDAVLSAEGDADAIVAKAKRAQLSTLWVKVADGQSRYANITGDLKTNFTRLVTAARNANIQIWGWQVPHCPDVTSAEAEATLLGNICRDFGLDGLIADAEGTAVFFQGGLAEAKAYGTTLHDVGATINKPTAISSNDIPQNIDGWLHKFNEIATRVKFNFPQTYYGASTSVASRVDRAATANSHLSIPFVPVGAGFLGTAEGGCASASDCGERAAAFIQLCKQRGYQGYSFWHWAGAPMPLWQVLNTTPV